MLIICVICFIIKWDTSHVKDMRSIFENCYSLTSLPDISKWNTSNVKDMYSMFCSCEHLSSLPDISKWNTSNVNSMARMFNSVSYYHHYLIYQNGILQMLII